MRKVTGWLLVVLGALGSTVAILQAPPAGAGGLGYSRLFGALVIPVLLAVAGVHVAGIIRRAK
jgi:hypothetical protein